MDENVGFLVCDTCGCVVDPSLLQQHSDWHDTLVTNAVVNTAVSVANPDRTRK